jgi:hypothetical protein
MWHVLETGEVQTGFWWGNLREGYHLEQLSIDKMIILECIFKKRNAMAWTDLAQFKNRWRGFYERGNEHSDSTKCGQFTDRLRNC